MRVPRTPLREVFRLLAGEGYIQIRDNRGTIVSPMSHRTLRDFFMTAPLIYASVARLAARNANLPPGTFRVSQEQLDLWSSWFEPPTADEPA